MATDRAHDADAARGTSPYQYHVFVAEFDNASPDGRLTSSYKDRTHAPRKRPHHKSRQGCIACKRRRVKCDNRAPCSSCVKRNEPCVHPKASSASANREAAPAQPKLAAQSAPTPTAPADAHVGVDPDASDTAINLLHMELFHHFQTSTAATLSYPDIWPQTVQWSFQEPYIMSAILCLSASHLAASRPHSTRYSRIALQLLTKSAALLGEKLSGPVDAQNVEKLMGASLLMQYIAWSHVGFLDAGQQSAAGHGVPLTPGAGSSGLDISQDPLFRLSSGIKDLFFESFPALWGNDKDSAFLSTSLYSPRLAIEQTLAQHGIDPGAHVAYFMGVWDDPRLPPTRTTPGPGQDAQQPPALSVSSSLARFEQFLSGPAPCCDCVKLQLSSTVAFFKRLTCHRAPGDTPSPSPSPPERHGDDTAPVIRCPHTVQPETLAALTLPPLQLGASDFERVAFRCVARGVSIVLCLAALVSPSSFARICPGNAAAPAPEWAAAVVAQLQPDIERYIFVLPVICANGSFRDLAFQGDVRALVVLLYFYRAARVLLAGPHSWWACDRSRVMEGLIARELQAKGWDVG
ncbi:hypothetical protein B0T26DRAFT_757417 [Lasiosphaeria miniovina]|uniref:Zn(2)-C6 fungal-type domain-containing protein n=1 Tax=Lasiosphaeria miniovina TaxID=1954250 RepID=A0AA39ZUT3_9PEZI|nr:uncharacterized protein B0T26DRAFT_757417 [Lasiosphaeria miniovina]KAK0703920.1 hypothetical protein B0T26DRAFT_757417 [Lasiosphaeria miniovina]